MRTAARMQHQLSGHVCKLRVEQMLDCARHIFEVDMRLFAALHRKRIGLRILAKDEIRHAQAGVAGTVEKRAVHLA